MAVQQERAVKRLLAANHTYATRERLNKCITGREAFLLALGGQIIDASIVPVAKQRNNRDENARIKDGATPEGWENQPAKRSQKDADARWTRKHGKPLRLQEPCHP